MSKIDIVLKAMEGKEQTVGNFLATIVSVSSYPDGLRIEEEEVENWVTEQHCGDLILERYRMATDSELAIFDKAWEFISSARGAPIYRWDRGEFVVLFVETKAKFDEMVQSARDYFDAEPVFDFDDE